MKREFVTIHLLSNLKEVLSREAASMDMSLNAYICTLIEKARQDDEIIRNRSTGYNNTGDYNTGDYNTGDYNTGNWNTGEFNTGNHNSGDYNSGDYNTGDFNLADCSPGCFNTLDQKIYMFDQPSDWTRRTWRCSRQNDILSRMPVRTTAFVEFGKMTDEEKLAHPEAEVTGGYLKRVDDTTVRAERQKWWNSLADWEKETIKDLPNFNSKIFWSITGINTEG